MSALSLRPVCSCDSRWVTCGIYPQGAGTQPDAAAFGEIVFDCTNGANSIAVLRLAGAANLRGKILIQVGNPLDFSKAMPPSLTVCNTDSRGSSCPAFRR